MARGFFTRLFRISPSSSSSPAQAHYSASSEISNARLQAQHKQRVHNLSTFVKELMQSKGFPVRDQTIVRWALGQLAFSHDVYRAENILNPNPAKFTLMTVGEEARLARDRRTPRATEAIHLLELLEKGVTRAQRHEIEWARGFIRRIFPTRA